MTEKSYFHGTSCIRKVAHECGAKFPQALSCTKLRKHVATVSKVLNLKDTEMDQLADFMGHDIRVHRKFYRLPEGTLQLAKISKVLLALEQGRVAEFKGKNLDEINLEPNEKVDLGSNVSESDDEESENETPQPRKRHQSPSTSTEECLVNSQSSRVSERQQPKKRRQSPSTSTVDCQSSRVIERHQPKKQSQSPSTSTEELPNAQISTKGRKMPSKSGPKRTWTEEEVKAVEDKLMDCITSGRVPSRVFYLTGSPAVGKCQPCLAVLPGALLLASVLRYPASVPLRPALALGLPVGSGRCVTPFVLVASECWREWKSVNQC
ncbi:unnamed protein product [Arctogadus glacialis]